MTQLHHIALTRASTSFQSCSDARFVAKSFFMRRYRTKAHTDIVPLPSYGHHGATQDRLGAHSPRLQVAPTCRILRWSTKKLLTSTRSRWNALSRSMLKVSTSSPVFAACVVRRSGQPVTCTDSSCGVGNIIMKLSTGSASMPGRMASLAIRHTETSTRCG